MYDLIIIGSGPAGLSAAVYGKRAGLNLLIIEEKPMSGGQILNTYEVDNYLGLPGISGFDMGMTFRQHAEKLGAEFLEATVHSVEERGDYKCVYAGNQELETRTVIFANGQIVVGGGDVALEDAIYLARTCEKVYLIHRRDSLRGAMVLQEELKSLPNVEILYDHVVTEICGEDMVEKLRIKNVKTEAEKDLEAAGIFIAVGIHPNTELLRELVAVGEDGYIPADETGETGRPGIYVAGDIRKKPLRQVVTAVADGANAAVSAGNYCNRFR